MNKEDNLVAKAYDKIAPVFQKRVKSNEFDHMYIEKFLLMFKSGDNILELGTGTGDIAHHMMKYHDINVTAIDFSKKMIKIAKKKYPKLSIKRMNIKKLTGLKKNIRRFLLIIH